MHGLSKLGKCLVTEERKLPFRFSGCETWILAPFTSAMRQRGSCMTCWLLGMKKTLGVAVNGLSHLMQQRYPWQVNESCLMLKVSNILFLSELQKRICGQRQAISDLSSFDPGKRSFKVLLNLFTNPAARQTDTTNFWFLAGVNKDLQYQIWSQERLNSCWHRRPGVSQAKLKINDAPWQSSDAMNLDEAAITCSRPDLAENLMYCRFNWNEIRLDSLYWWNQKWIFSNFTSLFLAVRRFSWFLSQNNRTIQPRCDTRTPFGCSLLASAQNTGTTIMEKGRTLICNWHTTSQQWVLTLLDTHTHTKSATGAFAQLRLFAWPFILVLRFIAYGSYSIGLPFRKLTWKEKTNFWPDFAHEGTSKTQPGTDPVCGFVPVRPFSDLLSQWDHNTSRNQTENHKTWQNTFIPGHHFVNPYDRHKMLSERIWNTREWPTLANAQTL